MSDSLCLSGLGLIWLASIGMLGYIGVDTILWVDDMQEWADEMHEIVSSGTTHCDQESKIYDLIDEIDTFYYMTYCFTGIVIYFFASLCYAAYSTTQNDSDPPMCARPICILCNWLMENIMTILFIIFYFIIIDLLQYIDRNTDLCGTSYQPILQESETYLDNLESFPAQYLLICYICQVVSVCCAGYVGMKEESSTPAPRPAPQPRPAPVHASSNSSQLQLARRTEGSASPAATQIAGMFASAAASSGRDRTESEELAVHIVGGLAFTVLGFEFATRENCDAAMKKLNSRVCSNRTALRDAIYSGFDRMLKLKAYLTKIGAFDHNFIHIVLTDGEDTCSKIEKPQFMAFQHVLNRQGFDKICKTVFVGVRLSLEAKRELLLYSILGGDSAEFKECDTMDIERVFNHISLNLIQTTRVAALQTENGTMVVGAQQRGLRLGLNHFLVLFTLDISVSMTGERWNAVKRAVKSLLDNLKSDDIFGIVLFNDKIHEITGAT